MSMTTMPAAVIKNATKIWDVDVTWTRSSQCSTWDAKGRAVVVWECKQDHCSTQSTAPPNPDYWRELGRR